MTYLQNIASGIQKRSRALSVFAYLMVMVPALVDAASDIRENNWRLQAGAGFASIGENYYVEAAGNRYELAVDSAFFPVIRCSRRSSRSVWFEGRASVDVFSGKIDTISGGSSDQLTGYTLGFGPVWYGRRDLKLMSLKGRPLLYGSAIFHHLRGGLSYPVSSFKPSWGFELGTGLSFGSLEWRIGARWLSLSEERRMADVTDSSGDLNFSGVYLEGSCMFLGWGKGP